jgi:hypothetical protein
MVNKQFEMEMRNMKKTISKLQEENEGKQYFIFEN